MIIPTTMGLAVCYLGRSKNYDKLNE